MKECSQQMKTVIQKAASIVNFVRKSTIATDVLENENRLRATYATRWNFQLYMLTSILEGVLDKIKYYRVQSQNDSMRGNFRMNCVIFYEGRSKSS